MRARPGTAAASGSAPEGFADVYERYFADIYRYIAGRLGRNVADDIAADTFVIALRKHADFDPGRGPVRAWLYGIATNLVAQHRRAEKRRYLALARAGLVTYCGPHWSSFGMGRHFGQTLQWFTACLFGDDPVRLEPATTWTDDLWFLDQDNREVLGTDGWWPLQPGHAAGRLVGGNLSTLSLLPGTPYMPSLAAAVLIVEDDEESHPANIARNLTSLPQLPDAAAIRGLVVGRFQRATNMTRPLLEQIIDRQPPLAGLPVLANVDVGHTSPMATLPIGGQITMSAEPSDPHLVLTRH